MQKNTLTRKEVGKDDYVLVKVKLSEFLINSSAMSEDLKHFADSFLKRIRDFVQAEKLKLQRLPKWVRAAHVRFAKLQRSAVFMFEDSPSKQDSCSYYGDVWSDLQFFLELPEYIPLSASLRARPFRNGIVIIIGEYVAEGKVVFNIKGIYPALFNVGYMHYHGPIALLNIFIQHTPLGEEVSAIRFIPFALYVHDKDIKKAIASFDTFWDRCTPHLQDTLRKIHFSEMGDYYQSIDQLQSSVLMSKKRSVIVFGKESDAKSRRELLQIRDYLRKSYDAYMLRDLPKNPSMSLEEKVKLWSSASKFSVMIDRLPSGHLVEYPYLKNTRVILALLRQKGKKSTAMVEDNSVDFPFIKTIEFGESPFEVLDIAVDWAEAYVKKRAGEKAR